MIVLLLLLAGDILGYRLLSSAPAAGGNAPAPATMVIPTLVASTPSIGDESIAGSQAAPA